MFNTNKLLYADDKKQYLPNIFLYGKSSYMDTLGPINIQRSTDFVSSKNILFNSND